MTASSSRFALVLMLAVTAVLTGCAAPAQPGKQILSTSKMYPAVGPYSQMVAHGGTIYLSGVLPLNAAGNAIQGTTIEEQTKAVLDHIGEKLKSQGLSHDDVLMSTVYLKDLNDFAAMNRVYGEYFKTNPPARATVQVARIPRDALIEIAVIVGRK
ncbi:translation initiation inhibitor [Janthinobacterium sp. Marseille]|nr:Rid family detoxifying hydrolase [Janthinobacterium sp. Marseille]ABR90235.1 translation initiation inhibitor [Janthinobacterium sp. Marseille]